MPEIQHITVQLDGITAGDYLAHQLDADPPLDTSPLRSVTIDVPHPLGNTIGAALCWEGRAPSPRAAAVAAGFALTADVVGVRGRVMPRCAPFLRGPVLTAAA
jgi:hypothetical protein